MLTERQRRFLDHSRVGHLATADAQGEPHLIPVCYAIDDATLYITIDEKPKRQDRPLKRVRNILENPQAAFVVDRWDEDGAASAGSCCAAPPRSSPPAPNTTMPRHCSPRATRNTARCTSPACRSSRCASRGRATGAISSHWSDRGQAFWRRSVRPGRSCHSPEIVYSSAEGRREAAMVTIVGQSGLCGAANDSCNQANDDTSPDS
jgi:hypothetical protein